MLASAFARKPYWRSEKRWRVLKPLGQKLHANLYAFRLNLSDKGQTGRMLPKNQKAPLWIHRGAWGLITASCFCF
jgi:hypothetical protein